MNGPMTRCAPVPNVVSELPLEEGRTLLFRGLLRSPSEYYQGRVRVFGYCATLGVRRGEVSKIS